MAFDILVVLSRKVSKKRVRKVQKYLNKKYLKNFQIALDLMGSI